MKEYSIYLIIKQGVYIQGIFGIYDNLALAKDAMKKAKILESDNYHYFHILGTNINKEEYIEDNLILVLLDKPNKKTVADKKSGIANMVKNKPIINSEKKI